MEYKGHEYEVERREREWQPEVGQYRYEFHLVVDGDDVITASELERRGYRGPEAEGGDNWTQNLRRYGKAYIDGLEA